jgi:hypothetical protein
MQVKLPLWGTDECTKKLNEGFFRNTSVRAWKAHPSHLCAGKEFRHLGRHFDFFAIT